MRALLLCLLLCPSLWALHTDPETARWARRALLDQQTRGHMQARVGETGVLKQAAVLHGDFAGDGRALTAVRLTTSRHAVVTILDGVACLARRAVIPGDAYLSSLATPDGDWLLIKRRAGGATLCEVFCLGDDGIRLVAAFVVDAAEVMDKRFQRKTTADVTVEGRSVRVVTRTRDYLDGEAMPQSEVSLSREFSSADGAEVARESHAPPVVSRLRNSRQLERERLVEAALLVAREAAKDAEGLPPDNAVALDAAALVARLEARSKVGTSIQR